MHIIIYDDVFEIIKAVSICFSLEAPPLFDANLLIRRYNVVVELLPVLLQTRQHA